MASLDSLQVRKLLGKGTVIQAGTDTPVSFRLRKTGSETSTSVTVTTATNIVLVGSTTTDTIDWATYATIGAVVDKINSTGRWEAKVLDALRSQASANTLVTGAVSASTDANGVIIWDVPQDTSASLQIAVCLSPVREWDAPKGHLAKLQEFKYSVNMNAAAADSAQIHRRRGTVEAVSYTHLTLPTICSV